MIEAQRQLALATEYLRKQDPIECQRVCTGLLNNNPALLPALHLRGLAAAQLEDHDSAIRDLSRVWPRDPRNVHAALWLGRSLRIRGDCESALPALRAACSEPVLELDARYEMGRVLTRLRQSAEAMLAYRRVLELQPNHANAAANLAFLLERANRLDEAGPVTDQALGLDPVNFMATLTKATLERRAGDTGAARLRLEGCLQQPLSPLNRSITLNQLAQCLLKEANYPAAYASYEESNALLRAHHPLAKPVDDGSYGLLTLHRYRQFLEAQPISGWTKAATKPALQPIFLVGFPRSGTTLLDQALSAHPEIEVLEEYEFFDDIRRQWVDGDQLDNLPGMDEQALESARQNYLSAVAARRKAPGRTWFVDKLPLNLVHLFLVHRLFPEAHILFMLRDPRDACLSCFFQAFDLQGAMPYFLDLQQTAQYYDQAMQLAQQSLDQVSNPVLQQRYEHLVTDFPASMRKILGFLGIAWDNEVLNYRQKSAGRIIDTPSYQQVTQPLYRDAIGRWRNFSAQLEPLQASLGPWIVKFDYPAS